MACFTTIASYTDLSAAYLARAKLEHFGIQCFLSNEHTIGVHWFYSNALGGVELKVLEEDIPDAIKILTETEAEPEVTSNTASPPSSVALCCPICGSENINARKYRPFIAMLSYAFLSLPILLRQKKQRCKKCGHSWEKSTD